MLHLQAEINTWVVLSVALPGMTSDPNVMLPAASVGMLLAIGTAGLTVSISCLTCMLPLGHQLFHCNKFACQGGTPQQQLCIRNSTPDLAALMSKTVLHNKICPNREVG